MCGIVGLYLKNPAWESRLGELFEPMLIAMTDRGPDSAGFSVYGDEYNAGIKLTLQSDDEAFDWAVLADRLGEAFGGWTAGSAMPTSRSSSWRPRKRRCAPGWTSRPPTCAC